VSVPENEAMAGRADTSLSCQQHGDCEVISNSVSASLDVNPFVGEGVRVSIGTTSDNERVLAAAAAWSAEH